MRRLLPLLALCLLACGDKGDDGDDGGDGTDGADGAADGTDGAGDGADGTTDSGTTATDPSPWTLEVTGALEQSIVFNQPTCSRPNGSANLRQFWRGDGHVFVLKVEVMGTATGPGTYTSAEHGVQATLQEEAGGSGAYFAAGDGDTVEMVVDELDDDADVAWGNWTVSGMSDTSGRSVALGPQPLPIWCPAFL